MELSLITKIITIFEFEEKLDAWAFWHREAPKYKSIDVIGECLLQPVEEEK